jgi:glycosyltransferase involved in cell wall biosynthesis
VIVGNLYFIKSTSGLFYYGVSYLKGNHALLRRVLVRPALERAAKQAFPEHEVVVCTALQMWRQALQAARRGDVIYTPTSHPLPGFSRQWIVVHDGYPFAGGWRGRIKKALLWLALATSGCRVAYINQTDALAFVRGLGISGERLLFAPNQYPDKPAAAVPLALAPEQALRVALVGTESDKKNYVLLFQAVMQAGGADRLCFHVFGHRNAYLSQLEARFPAVQIQLVSSDEYSLEDLLAGVHVLASVALQEGFGRPIAGALLAGVPCLLLNCPVFNEFFNPGAEFFSDATSLVAALLAYAGTEPLLRPDYAAPAQVLEAYRRASATLQHDGALCP